MQTLKLKNYQLNVIGKVINYPMKFQSGRVKNQLIRLLGEKSETMEKNRKEIITELCTKDEKGDPIVNNGKYDFTPENQAKFNEEYEKLIQESCDIDVLPTILAILPEVKSIINNSPIELQSYEVNSLEEFVTAIDEVLPSKKK